MKKAFVFPGQGSQIVGMGKDFYDNFDISKKVFEEVDEALGKKLSKTIFEGDQELLTQTENAQPALMCVSIAILKALEKESGESIQDLCSFIAGHSLGEYSALCAGEALTLSDTAKLLKIRGEAFAEAGTKSNGGMVALVGATIEQAEEVVKKSKLPDEILQIANDNTVGQIVISGNTKSIDESIKIATEIGIKRAIKLPVSGAFHSELMKPAVEKMQKALENIEILTPKTEFVANFFAKPLKTSEEIKNGLLKQITGRVRWRETMTYFEENGIENIIEIGAGKVLSGMVAKTCKTATGFSINSIESMKEFLLNK